MTRHKKRKLVSGVGNNDADYIVDKTINGQRVVCPIYRTWHNMIERCYSVKNQLRQPSYIGCTVDKRWHSFRTFRKWVEKQEWKGKALDKDLIIPGNKLYSPETCLFVSQAINNLLGDHAASRGKYPQGVSWIKRRKKYIAQVSINGKTKRLGYFSSSEAAEAVYKVAKSNQIIKISKQQEDKKLRLILARHATLIAKTI